jgi:Peptidase M15
MWRRALKLTAAALAVILAAGVPAKADFRFSSQRSLSLPDPFLRARPRRQRPAPAHPAPFGPMQPRGAGLDSGLIALIAALEAQFHAKPSIVSGCRSQAHNAAVGGARHSFHLSCAAADITIPGVSPQSVRAFALTMPGRGGVGTYCGMSIVHIDVGPVRQWHRGCGMLAALGDDPFALN